MVQDGATGFLPKIEVILGGLVVDSKCPVGDLLHEAGHLAILPAHIRAQATGDLAGIAAPLLLAVKSSVDPDSAAARAAINCGDSEATAWAWAAGKHLGIPGHAIIESSAYDGDGATVRAMLAAGLYPGIHGLAAAGFCVTKPGDLELHTGLPAYPRLAHWLQP